MPKSRITLSTGRYECSNTPGPLGWNDFAVPEQLACTLGDTPSSLGRNDYASHEHVKSRRVKKTVKKDLLKAAFEKAKALGWLPYFEVAARKYHFDEEVLLAIGYRETNLNPIYLSVPGDKGHGYGLMQADVNSFKPWIDAGHWKDARKCILKGAEVLATKRDELSPLAGTTVKVKDHSGKSHEFTGKKIDRKDLLQIAIAAYNSGLWAYYHYSNGHDIDKGTTGQNYSRDVLAKAKRFRALLDAEQPASAASSVPPDFVGPRQVLP